MRQRVITKKELQPRILNEDITEVAATSEELAANKEETAAAAQEMSATSAEIETATKMILLYGLK